MRGARSRRAPQASIADRGHSHLLATPVQSLRQPDPRPQARGRDARSPQVSPQRDPIALTAYICALDASTWLPRAGFGALDFGQQKAARRLI